MVNLEYRVGGLDPFLSTGLSKFIVHRDSESALGIYALAGNLIPHKYIAEHFGLQKENVLGGGIYRISPRNVLFLERESADFGSLPKEAAKKVGETLADYLRQKDTKIARVKNDMIPLYPYPLNRKNAEIWKSLGFDV